jgi:hypothetical protein
MAHVIEIVHPHGRGRILFCLDNCYLRGLRCGNGPGEIGPYHNIGNRMRLRAGQPHGMKDFFASPAQVWYSKGRHALLSSGRALGQRRAAQGT